MIEKTNGIIKTQLAKMTETFNLPWPKTLPLLLSNLRLTTFGKHKLSPFETVTRRLQDWTLGPVSPHWSKEKYLNTAKKQLKALKKNARILPGDEDLLCHDL